MKKMALALVVLFALFWFSNMAIGVKSAAIRANQKACFEQIGEMQFAVDVIEDNCKADLATGTSGIKLLNQETLVEKKCLKRLYKCPFSGIYKLSEVSGGQTVYCSFHGAPDGAVPGKLDPGYSLIYWFVKWLKGIFK